MKAGLALNRLWSTSWLACLMPSAPGWMMLSRLVYSMANRSTVGVLLTLGGKWPPLLTGATKPGPKRGLFGSRRSGLVFSSLGVIVVWLMNWIVREVKGASSLAKKAPVRASARA